MKKCVIYLYVDGVGVMSSFPRRTIGLGYKSPSSPNSLCPHPHLAKRLEDRLLGISFSAKRLNERRQKRGRWQPLLIVRERQAIFTRGSSCAIQHVVASGGIVYHSRRLYNRP
jgi:hypothetical protein